jgi:hypothetical protein
VTATNERGSGEIAETPFRAPTILRALVS